MRFGAPAWLWLLTVLPLIYWMIRTDEKRRQRQFALFADRSVWGTIVPEVDFSARLRKAKLWLAALAFAILAIARPQWGSHEETIHVSGLDILFVIDVSNSMETEDVVPSRLKKAKHLVRSILDRLHGDRAGVVAFAASSYVACPLTTDLEYLWDTVQILSPKTITNQGTDIGIALDTARRSLERGAEEPGGATEGAPASKIVILISDGEDHEEGLASEVKKLHESGVKLYVLGVGTQKGGPVPIRDDSGNLHGYKKDHRGQPVVSAFKPDVLLELATASGGRYWSVTAAESEVDELLQDLMVQDRSDFAERRYVVYEERFQIPLAIAVILILLEIAVPARKLGRVVLVLFSSFALFSSEFAYAASPTAPLESYLENEKGIKAFKEGKIDEAKKNFGTAQALDPTSPELQFNQGVIQMQQGEVDSAIQAFSEAARDPRLAASSFYNLAGALTKKGDIPGAIRSYLAAIGSAKKTENQELENDARKNLELLFKESDKKKQEQQQQQQKQQQQQGDEGKKDDQQKQENQEKKQEPKQYKDNSKEKKQFKSQKLSDEDAERVMSELKNRERELQKRLKKQQGTQGGQKDW